MKDLTKRYVVIALLILVAVIGWQVSLNQVQAQLAATLLAYGQTMPPYNPIIRPSPGTQDILEGQYQIYLQDKAEMEWDIAWVTAQAVGYHVTQSDGQRVEKTIWLDEAQLHLTRITDHLAILDTHK